MALSKVSRLSMLLDNQYLRRSMLCRPKREFGVHPINEQRKIFGEFHHLYGELRKYPDRFFQYTRMSIQTFDFLLHKIEFRLQKQTTNYQRPISPAERLIITLRYLATGSSFRHLAFAFRVGKSTVSNIVTETCEVIWDELMSEFMPQPTTEHLKEIATDYYRRWNFPNCFGSIDGKHCQIKCPANSGSSFFNYLRYFSIVLQGVADANKKFLTIEVGSRGKQSDGGIFLASTLFKLLESRQFNVPAEQALPNSNIELPFVLIGDEAYPLKSYLMRPYPGRGLTPKRELFNSHLSTARKCVECAFGILCAKWRFLSKDIETSVDKAVKLIKCACLLHNLIRERDGDSDLHYREVMQNVDTVPVSPTCNEPCRRNNNSSLFAKETRDKFADYFSSLQEIN